jgi:hypothetical protein
MTKFLIALVTTVALVSSVQAADLPKELQGKWCLVNKNHLVPGPTYMFSFERPTDDCVVEEFDARSVKGLEWDFDEGRLTIWGNPKPKRVNKR